VPVGDYPFVIVGDTGFTTHNLNAVLHVGDFGAASVSPASATLSVGQSATFNLTASATNGFNDPIAFFCSAAVNGKPVNGIRCAFSPAIGTFDATGKLTDQVTITANARPQSAVVTARAQSAAGLSLPATITLLFVAGLVVIGSGKKGKNTIAMTCVLLFSLAVISCGGGGGGGTGGGTVPPPTPSPTPAGPVSVVVTVFGSSNIQFQSQPKPMTTFTVTVQN
jgi:hypothetical protein